MTYSISLNLIKVNEWALSLNAAVVMGVFADLESWADKCRSGEPNDGDFYYTLYHNKILKELPFLGSRSTVVRAVRELEEKGLVKSINKHSTPAYALTEKGIGWKKVQPEPQPNGGESEEAKPETAKAPKKERRKHRFSLAQKVFFDELAPEYLHELKIAAHEKCEQLGIPSDEYESFARYYIKTGTKYRNWLMAFGDWCRNHIKRNAKPNGADFTGNDGGLY